MCLFFGARYPLCIPCQLRRDGCIVRVHLHLLFFIETYICRYKITYYCTNLYVQENICIYVYVYISIDTVDREIFLRTH
jgi:hypothetical protein